MSSFRSKRAARRARFGPLALLLVPFRFLRSVLTMIMLVMRVFGAPNIPEPPARNQVTDVQKKR